MNKAEKFLRELSFDERQKIKDVLTKILSGKTKGLDVKKLKGYKNLFRVRVGDIRVVFSQDGKIVGILFIGKRGSLKYNQF